MELCYDLSGLEYISHRGIEETFQGIKDMMELLPYGSDYYHFVGHPDVSWNKSGMPDKSREEIVPLKRAKKIRTHGLYYPSVWLTEKFGGEKAKLEQRDMHFLPNGVSIPVRFYCYGDSVYYIFEDGEDFNSIEITGNDYSTRHKELVGKFSNFDMLPYGRESRICISYPESDDELVVGGISSFLLLDSIANGFSSITIDDEYVKTGFSNLADELEGVKLEVH